MTTWLVLSKAKELAKRTACLINLKHIFFLTFTTIWLV
jgi:hypothetical protein